MAHPSYGALALTALLAAACYTPPDPFGDVCEGVRCGEGRCVLDQDRPACLCQPGFRPEGLACLSADAGPPDLCQPNPCTQPHRTVCSMKAGVVRCACEPGSYERNGECLQGTPCSPNPCTGANQTVCTVKGSEHSCSCEPGYAPVGSGCGPDQVYDCALQHSGDGSDPFEPDECPDQAHDLAANGVPETGHTVAPAADSDWYRLGTEAGHVYRISGSGSSVALYLDVYGADGLSIIGFDHRGSAAPQARFKSGVSGVGYVRVRAFRANDTGPYQLTAEDLGLDDYADTPATATPLTVGGQITGEVQFPGDADVLRVPLAAGAKYAFTLTGPPGLGLELLDPAGATVLRWARGSPSAMIVTRPGPSGDYYLRVSAALSVETAPFTLRLEDWGPDDHGDAPAEATPVTAGAPLTLGTLERPGDYDVFSFSAQAGRIYAFTCTPQSYGSCTASIVDANGAVLAVSSGYSSSSAYVAWEATQSGTFYARATSSYGTGPYSYRLEDLGPDDHGDSPAAASGATVGMTGAGRLETAYDKDVFSFPATSPRVYRASCTPGAGLSSCVVRITNLAGVTLAASSSSGYGTVSAAYEAPGSGTLYFEVSGPSYGNSVGGYSFTLEDLGADDHGDTPATATAITVSSAPAAGTLEASGDVDVFSFSATAPNIYRFTCTTPTYNGCSLRLRNSAGALLANGSGGSTSVALTYEMSSSGTYYVEVYPASSASGVAYTYRLENLGPDDHGDSIAAATAITANGLQATGSLETPGDIDAFSFTAVAPRVYSFTCGSGGYSGGCTAAMKNAAGVTLASSGSSGSVSYEVSASGTYFVEVSNYYGGGSTAYTYRLEDLGADDHGDTIATATAILVPTAPTAARLEHSSDADVFSFTATANHVYRFTCAAGAGGSCGGVRFRDSSGIVLATGYGSYSTVVLAYEVATGGTYYAEVYGSGYSTFGSYTYQLEDLGLDDHGDTAATATALPALSTFVAGRLEFAGDLDYFSITLPAASSHQVQVSGASVLVGVYSTDGFTQLAYESYPPRLFTTTTAGTYYVRVRSNYSGGTGTYSIAVQ